MSPLYQPTAGAPPPSPEGELVSIPLSEEEVGQWRQRIQQSIDRREQEEARWEILLKEYLPTVKAGNETEALKVNTHFRNVQTKIGLLFVRRPEIQLTPKGPADAMVLEQSTPRPGCRSSRPPRRRFPSSRRS